MSDSRQPHFPSPVPLRVNAGALPPPARRAADDRHLRAWMHEGLHDLPHDSAILALGCDEPFLAPQLLEYSGDVTVLEMSGGSTTQRARRFPDLAFLRHDPANPLPFAHDTFDAIWCSEFLDRVVDPASTLGEMHRVLAPGGRLLVTVPDHGTLRNVLIALFKWDDHFAPTNPRIRHFTRSTLVRLAHAAGFESVRTSTGGCVRPVAGRLVPRSLLLTARKSPAIALKRVGRAQASETNDLALPEDLAFASRSRAG